jgi:hypothetical protein
MATAEQFEREAAELEQEGRRIRSVSRLFGPHVAEAWAQRWTIIAPAHPQRPKQVLFVAGLLDPRRLAAIRASCAENHSSAALRTASASALFDFIHSSQTARRPNFLSENVHEQNHYFGA